MFRKYDSIENHYREAYIRKAMDNDPKLRDMIFILQEKIHGANISFLFTKDGEFKVYSRNQEINFSGTDFNDIGSVIRDYPISEFCNNMKWYSKQYKIDLRFYGEFFGPGIQKGVDYGKEKRILFYDMMKNDEMTSQCDFSIFMDDIGFKNLKVPKIAFVNGLENALQYKVNIQSHLGPKDPDNIMEGVVIKPYFVVKTDHFGRLFYIKNKNNEFQEKVKAKKRKQYSPENPIIVELRAEYESYLTDMRMQSVFSKMGNIEEPSQIGDYLKAFSADATEDFLKDFGDRFKDLTVGEQRSITGSAGKIGVKILKTYL